MIIKKTLKWDGSKDFFLFDFYEKISDYHNILSHEENLHLIETESGSTYSKEFLNLHKDVNFNDFDEKHKFLIDLIKEKSKSLHEYDNIINGYNNIIDIKNKIENSENIMNILEFSELLQDSFLNFSNQQKSHDLASILTVQFENKNVEYFYFEPILFTIANGLKENKIIYKDKNNKCRINILSLSYHYLNRNILNKLLSFIGVSHIKKNTYETASNFRTLSSDKSKYYENDLNNIKDLSFEIDVHFNTKNIVLLFEIKKITGNWYDKNDYKNNNSLNNTQYTINEIYSKQILYNENKRMIVSLCPFFEKDIDFILTENITKYF